MPPHGWMSIAPPSPIATSRTRPVPVGGLTDRVRTRPGLAASSSSPIQRSLTGWSSPISRLRAASSTSRLTAWGSAMSKSMRPPSSAIWPPVIGNGTCDSSRWSRVWTRMWRWRRSQSISPVTASPGAGAASPSRGTWTTSPGASPWTVVAMASSRPSASVSRPLSPGWPPPVA